MKIKIMFTILMFITGFCFADELQIPYTFSPGALIKSSEMNSNFDEIEKIINGKIDYYNIKDKGITNSDLADDSIYHWNIADYTISETNLANNCINSAKIQDGSITETDLDIANNPVANYGLFYNGTKMEWRTTTGLFGTGTENKIPKWQTTTTLTDSIIYETANKIGINSTNPEFRLTLDKGAVNPDGGILAIGTIDSGDTLTVSGTGTRLIWYPRKGAFRAGYVSGDKWDNANIGKNSVAFGDNSVSGQNSFAIGGAGNLVNNNYSGVLGGMMNSVYGDNSIILGGLVNEINSNSSFILGGVFNDTYSAYSVSEGYGATTTIVGQHAHATSNGTTQWSYIHLCGNTTDNTTIVLYPDANSNNKLVIGANTAWLFRANIAGKASGSNNVCSYEVKGMIVRDNLNNTTVKGVSTTVIYEDTALVNADATAVADDVNEALEISVTGVLDYTIRWSAKIELIETTIQ